MTESTRLNRGDLAAQPALDWRSLFAQGMAHLRDLSGQRWTDHNLHDPGITTLELACHALTDLAYRCGLPLADRLASVTAPGEDPADQFWRARQALPQAPLTERDLRKLLIDRVGVRNAWLRPVDDVTLWVDPVRRALQIEPPHLPGEREVVLQGLWRVLIETTDEVDTLAEREALWAELRTVLQGHRTLCQDIIDISEVPVQHFALCAELELSRDADPTRCAAALLHAAEQTLAPPLRPLSLSALLARPHNDGRPRRVDEVFEGPLLAHGFIDDDELDASALPATVQLSDLISALMDVPGVQALRDIRLQPLDAAGEPVDTLDPWRIPVTPGHAPRLTLDSGRLVFHQRGMVVAGYPVPDMPDAVRGALQALHDADRAALDTPQQDDLRPPAGRARSLTGYRSFQLDFPALYGLGEAGLGAAAPAADRARVLQLKAYLLFIDQWMANQVAQFAEAPRLFSVAPGHLDALAQPWLLGETPQPTLRAQRVTSVPGHAQLYVELPGDALDDAGLTRLFEPDPGPRQQQLLDHLLARAAEDFSDYAAVLRSAFGGSDAQQIVDKAMFLRDLPALGAERALAYDQTLQAPGDLWNSANVSGLERRIARLLGIRDARRRSLAMVSYDTYAEVDGTPGDEFRFRVRHAVTNKILLSSSTHYLSPDAARDEMVRAIARGQLPEAFQRNLTVDGRHYFNIVDAGGEVIARRIEYFATEAAMNDAIAFLMLYLREHYSGEGMHMVELLLLRPTQADDPLLPICRDAGCADCANDDPYSYRLQFVLPAYAGRFSNMAFRQYAESVIRAEVPAHCLPKICWVDSDHMALFEGAYRDWLSLHAGVTLADRQAKTQAFIDALTQVKNIYPAQTLTDCAAEVERPPFQLGRSALGTAPPPGPPAPPPPQS